MFSEIPWSFIWPGTNPVLYKNPVLAQQFFLVNCFLNEEIHDSFHV